MATILVVDDEMGIRALLSEILTDEGHSIELAENAAQARAARDRLRPDLVLLDIWMPDVDGITLLKEWGATGLLNIDRKSTRLNSSHNPASRMPSSA
jgi:DNA-binding NtrC family response regulator